MFTPLPSFVGGLLLSYSTSALLVTQGRILGCSGVAHGAIDALVNALGQQGTLKEDKGMARSQLPQEVGADGWKIATLGGLVAGGGLLRLVRPELERLLGTAIFDAPLSFGQVGTLRVLIAGFLVGAGTRLANGCTSGHMLLGLARLSKRSLAAVVTFFASALLTSRLAPMAVRLGPEATALRNTAGFPSMALALLAVPPLLSLAPLRPPSGSRSTLPPHLARLHAFLLGMTFTIGLALAGMTRPSKVLAFFAVPLPFLPSPPAGAVWDPSLAMVALGGLLPNVAVWQAVKRWQAPLRATTWQVPQGGKVDVRLLLGALLFGVGWGLVGICPGPLLAVLGAGPAVSGGAIMAFAGAFAVGGLAVRRANA